MLSSIDLKGGHGAECGKALRGDGSKDFHGYT